MGRPSSPSDMARLHYQEAQDAIKCLQKALSNCGEDLVKRDVIMESIARLQKYERPVDVQTGKFMVLNRRNQGRKLTARTRKHILLLLSRGFDVETIAQTFGVCKNTIWNIRKKNTEKAAA